MNTLKWKRVYDLHKPLTATGFTVDQLWPRGVSKEKALDEWAKPITPSTEIRKAYHEGRSISRTFQ